MSTTRIMHSLSMSSNRVTEWWFSDGAGLLTDSVHAKPLLNTMLGHRLCTTVALGDASVWLFKDVLVYAYVCVCVCVRVCD